MKTIYHTLYYRFEHTSDIAYFPHDLQKFDKAVQNMLDAKWTLHGSSSPMIAHGTVVGMIQTFTMDVRDGIEVKMIDKAEGDTGI